MIGKNLTNIAKVESRGKIYFKTSGFTINYRLSSLNKFDYIRLSRLFGLCRDQGIYMDTKWTNIAKVESRSKVYFGYLL